jgi:energy-coupling factor transport system permease protein
VNRKAATLDPRSKLILVCATSGILGTLDRWPYLLAAAGFLWIVAWWKGWRKEWWKFCQGLGPAVLVFFAVAWLAFDRALALSAASRLLALGTIFFLFFQATSPQDLAQALVRLGLPYSISFVLIVAMEFIPVLARRAANIRDAQRSRGIPVGGGWRGLRYLPALLGPLLIQAFKLADEMAEAMEARGFGSAGRRSDKELRFRFWDWIVSALSVALLAACLLRY